MSLRDGTTLKVLSWSLLLAGQDVSRGKSYNQPWGGRPCYWAHSLHCSFMDTRFMISSSTRGPMRQADDKLVGDFFFSNRYSLMGIDMRLTVPPTL